MYLSGLPRPSRSHVVAIGTLVFLSTCLSWIIAHLERRYPTVPLSASTRTHRVQPMNSYSWIGGDHPTRLPVKQEYVKMVIQESVHYDINAPESDLEWLYTNAFGDDGHIRLGDSYRMFAVAMFHELHCLRVIRRVMDNGWDSISTARQGHILHCFNYLRQYILCTADVTLEPGDFTKRNMTLKRTGATHTCVNWEPAYDIMYEKWKDWKEYRIAYGIPLHDVD